MTDTIESDFVTLQGERLFLRQAGDGASLLLLHAGVADGRMWQPQMETLAHSFHVVAPDLRGFGNSPLPNGPFSHHEVVAGLINALALKPAWLVGASLGGRVAVDFTLTHPQMVRGLVLVAPLVSGFEPDDFIEAFGQEEDRLLEAGDLESATELNLRTWVDGPYRSPAQVDGKVRAQVARMQRHVFEVPVPAGVELLKLDPPAIQRLDEIQVPTLIVVGQLDVAAVVTHAEQLAAEIPGAKLELVPQVAHMVTMEAPETFNKLVQMFVEQHDK